MPAPLQGQATIAGMTGMRYWADQDPTDFVRAAQAAFEREQQEWRPRDTKGRCLRPHSWRFPAAARTGPSVPAC